MVPQDAGKQRYYGNYTLIFASMRKPMYAPFGLGGWSRYTESDDNNVGTGGIESIVFELHAASNSGGIVQAFV